MGQWLTFGIRELEHIYMKSRMANGTTSYHSDCDKQMMPPRFPLGNARLLVFLQLLSGNCRIVSSLGWI
jgi:hypothetical protein